MKPNRIGLRPPTVNAVQKMNYTRFLHKRGTHRNTETIPRKQLRYRRLVFALAFEQDVDRTGSIAALANSKVLLVYDLENPDKVNVEGPIYMSCVRGSARKRAT